MKGINLMLLVLFAGISLKAQLPKAYGTIREDYTQAKFDTASRSIMSYNQDGNLNSLMYQAFHKGTRLWTNTSHYVYTVNGDGNRSHFVNLSWSQQFNNWDTLSGFFVNWTGPKTKTHTEVWYYSNGRQNLSLDSHFYNTSNNEMLAKTYWWNANKGIYEYMGYINHVYNIDGLVILSQSHWLDTINQKWDTTGRTLYTYHSNQLQDSVYSQSYSSLTGFRNESANVNSYDAQGNKVLNYYLTNNGSQFGLEFLFKTEYTYHPDEREDVTFNYQWNAAFMDFEPFDRITYLYQDLTGIDQIKDELISIYPNPATNLINLDLPVDFLGSSISLIDLQGREVLQTRISDLHTELSVSNQESGIYVLLIKGIDGSISTSTIIKK